MADRSWVLTDKARSALGLPEPAPVREIVLVPLLNIPARDDRRDLRREGARR